MRGDHDFIAQSEQSIRVDHCRAVIVGRLGRSRQVRYGGGGGGGNLGDRPRATPVNAWRQGPIEAISGKIRRSGLCQGKADRIPIRVSGHQRHRRWCLTNEHIVHIPAIHDHGTVCDQSEADAKVWSACVG